jgi:hypothetical protein
MYVYNLGKSWSSGKTGKFEAEKNMYIYCLLLKSESTNHRIALSVQRIDVSCLEIDGRLMVSICVRLQSNNDVVITLALSDTSEIQIG